MGLTLLQNSNKIMDDSSKHSVSSDSSDSKKSLHSSEYSSNGSSHEQEKAGLSHGVKEKRIVLASKLVVFLIIFAAAAVLSTLTFIFVEQSEERELLDAVSYHVFIRNFNTSTSISACLTILDSSPTVPLALGKALFHYH